MIGTVSLPLIAPSSMTPDSVPDEPKAESLTSLELVLRHHAGDPNAIEVLFARYEVRLQRWAHGRLSKSARGVLQTHDLVQDTLLRVFRNIGGFKPRHDGAFEGYVRTTLRNRVNDALREYQRRGPSESLDDRFADDEPSPLERAVGREALDRYEHALERLRPEDRELIVARFEMGRSYKEMMTMFQKPSVPAVTMATKRALVRLATEMARDRHS